MNFVNRPALVALTGSRLYGIATPTSDVDYISVTIPDKEYLYGLKTFEQSIVKKDNSENTVYSLLKFFKNLMNGSINSLEALYSDETIANAIGEKLISQREIFLSKKFVDATLHYALSEFYRFQSITVRINTGLVDKDELFHRFINVFQLDRLKREEIIKIVENSNGPITKIESTLDKVGEKRRSLIDKYGYDTKSASHWYRLLSEANELLTEGKLIFPRSEATFLSRIRNGEFKSEYIIEMGQKLLRAIEELKGRTSFPAVAPVEAVHRLYMELIDG